MAGRALPSSCLLVLLAAGTTTAHAEGEGIAVGEPRPDGQQQQQQERAEAPALPKLLGYGKAEDGTHAFLFGRQGAPPVVFFGKPGDLQELEVLGIERGKGKFMVDTLEMGDLVFNTTEKSVIIPGEVGFNTKNPTRVMKGKPDQTVFVEAMARMGFVRRAPGPAQVVPEGVGRLVARSRSLEAVGAPNGRLAAFRNKGRIRPTMKAKTRRPIGRVGVGARGRQTGRAAARVSAH